MIVCDAVVWGMRTGRRAGRYLSGQNAGGRLLRVVYVAHPKTLIDSSIPSLQRRLLRAGSRPSFSAALAAQVRVSGGSGREESQCKARPAQRAAPSRTLLLSPLTRQHIAHQVGLPVRLKRADHHWLSRRRWVGTSPAGSRSTRGLSGTAGNSEGRPCLSSNRLAGQEAVAQRKSSAKAASAPNSTLKRVPILACRRPPSKAVTQHAMTGHSQRPCVRFHRSRRCRGSVVGREARGRLQWAVV